MKHKANNKHQKAKIDPEFDKEVIRLRKQGDTIKKIAEKLHAGQARVTGTINRLIENGELEEEYTSLKNIRREERKQRVFELAKEGKTVREIGKILNIPLGSVYLNMRELIQEEKIVKTNSDTSLEDEALQLIEKGYNKMQIRKELHIGSKTLESILHKMYGEGRISRDFWGYSKKGAEQRKKEIKELINEGYASKEIARILKMNPEVCNRFIDELVKRGEVQLSEKNKKEMERAAWIEQRASELMAQGCNRQKISRKLHVNYSELNPIIDKIIIKLEKEKNDVGNRVIDSNSDAENKKDYVPNPKVAQDSKEKIEQLKVGMKSGNIKESTKRQFFYECKNVVENGGKLEKDDLDALAETIAYGAGKLDMSSLRFIGTEYAKIGDLQPAIKLSTDCIARYGEIKELLGYRSILLEMQKKQKIINMIKKGASIASIVMETGEREVEILRLKREYKAEKEEEIEI